MIDGPATSAAPPEPRPAVCFVAPYAYGELAGIDNGHVGGIERQQVMMARWLAKRGHRVHLITWDHGQPDGTRIEGVTVNTLCRQDAGLPGLRFLHPRWTSFWSALRRADADVYYYNVGDMGLGQLAMWCRRNGKRCVYSVASEPDCDPTLPVLKPIRERVLYRYGLRHADRILVQTRRQQEMLRTGFGLEASLMPMPCDGPAEAEFVSRSAGVTDRPRVLWVGRLSREKRVEWLLDAAERCGEFHFDLIGDANAESDYVRAMRQRASRPTNVTLHGRLPRERVLPFYRHATCLCCTSSYEGFPNTFLEAWSHGIPVVSTFDPDGLIVERGLGVFAADVDGLVAGIRAMATRADEWRTIARSARVYFMEHHTLDAVMPRFARVFGEVVGTLSGRAAVEAIVPRGTVAGGA